MISDADGAFSLTLPIDQGLYVEMQRRRTADGFSLPGGRCWRGANRRPWTSDPARGGRDHGPRRVRRRRASLGWRLAYRHGSRRVETRRADGSAANTSHIPTDAAGHYRLEHLPPGTYTVYLLGIEGSYVTPPTTVIAEENIVVRAGETTSRDLRAVVGRGLEVRGVETRTRTNPWAS